MQYAFHSRLTVEQSYKLERVQKVCLKVILGEMYLDYESALEMCALQPLFKRRQERCLSFALKCIKHPRNNRLFPLNPNLGQNKIREREMFQVNHAGGEAYKNELFHTANDPLALTNFQASSFYLN